MSSNIGNVSTKTWWLVFLVSTVVQIAFFVFWTEWCWVPMPFFFTALIKGFDWL